MSKTIPELSQELEQKQARVDAILDQYGDADLPKEAITELTELETSMQPIEHELVERRGAQETANGVRERSAARRSFLNDPVSRPAMPNGNGGQVSPDGVRRMAQDAAEGKSIGERFVNSPEFRGFMQGLAPKGAHVSETAKVGQSPRLELEGVGFRDLVTGASATSGGALVQRDYYSLVNLPQRPLTIRDIITIGQTGSDLVEYPRVESTTNNAAAVAEATATSGGSGVKPESALVTSKQTAAVKTIAHWMAITKRALSDAPQMRTLIDQFGFYGLQEELEDQIVAGNGSGENFDGLSHVSGTTSQAFSTDILTTVRKARTKVRVTGRAKATAVLMHPNDWEDFDLAADNEQRYYFGGPMEMGNPRLWGLPVVESEAVTEGQAWVGDFKTIVLFDRELPNVSISDAHSDFFVRNMVAVLFELRAALAFLRPAALCSIDLTA